MSADLVCVFFCGDGSRIIAALSQQGLLSSKPFDAGLDRFSRVLRQPFCHGPDAGLVAELVLLPDVYDDVALDLADIRHLLLLR